MSTIPFERYDDEFKSLVDQVKTSLEGGDSADIDFSINVLGQCEDLLKQMSVEARGVDDAASKRELLQKVRVCKAQLANLKDDVRSAKNKQDRAALELSGGEGGGKGGSANAGKERLLQSQNQLQSQNDTLDRARRVMAETEDVALEITTELGRNRETLESAHGRVREVSGLTNRARRLLQNMNRRAVQQKLALYGVGIAICIVVLIMIWNLR
eukprot:CAMPEP_0194029932 /NCGR_PEP_ID=MMETSP0009_2-20130614/3556_1 /TAXON_ID=210454 /ORGANISM="Grammatophora oceanica, Strain CCMP 410" /LENGTH=212 /DNA_ID=CAMNT_0038669755 /DNA_START=34 /DNA_END=672 /DNA_ORIENTATION=+